MGEARRTHYHQPTRKENQQQNFSVSDLLYKYNVQRAMDATSMNIDSVTYPGRESTAWWSRAFTSSNPLIGDVVCSTTKRCISIVWIY